MQALSLEQLHGNSHEIFNLYELAQEAKVLAQSSAWDEEKKEVEKKYVDLAKRLASIADSLDLGEQCMIDVTTGLYKVTDGAQAMNRNMQSKGQNGQSVLVKSELLLDPGAELKDASGNVFKVVETTKKDDDDDDKEEKKDENEEGDEEKKEEDSDDEGSEHGINWKKISTKNNFKMRNSKTDLSSPFNRTVMKSKSNSITSL